VEKCEKRLFFEELARVYSSENRHPNWEWEDIESNSHLDEILSYMAYNLSKSVLHGPLPDALHNRMVLGNTNEWNRAYLEYLNGSEVG
jgi:hypothetical protein